MNIQGNNKTRKEKSLLETEKMNQQWIHKKMQEAMDAKTFVKTPLANMLDHQGYPLAVAGYQRFVEFLNQDEVIHNPSLEERLGVLDIAVAIEAMAKGYNIDPIQLSSLPCGTGKTTIIKFMLLELLASNLEVGAVICLSRNASVISLAKEIEREAPDLFEHVAIYTSDPRMSKHGSYDRVHAHTAPVVITTQQHVTGNHTNKDTVFNYLGNPRQVKIWDEWFNLGEVSELSINDLYSIGSTLPKEVLYTDILAKLNDLIVSLSQAENDTEIDVFDFARYLSLIGKASYLNSIKNEDLRLNAETLWSLSNKKAKVCSTHLGAVFLRYEQSIPEELLPILITDASGQCRHVYKLMSKFRYSVCNRYSAKRDNKNITFHVWNIAGGRNKFKIASEVHKRAEGFSKVLNDTKDESLIFHFKTINNGRYGVLDFKEIIKEYTGEQDNHHYLQYGYHTSTNEYKDITNIFMFGNLYPTTAFATGSALLHSDDQASHEDIEMTKVGEFLHDLMQAVYRGNGRNSENGTSGKSDIYLMMSDRQGYLKYIKELFPKANFVSWNCNGESLLAKSIKLVKKEINNHKTVKGSLEGFEVTFKDLIGKLECSRQHFTRVRNNPSFTKFLEHNELKQVGKSKSPTDKYKSTIAHHSYF